MSKIALIDIDGVIANNEARFAKAEEAKAAYLAQDGMTLEPGNHGGVITQYGTVQDSDLKRANDLYWKTAFTSEFVRLDTVIDGTREALEQIGNFAEYDIYFLTSRPETLREATMTWLFWNIDFDSDTHLIMKPASQQYVKTVTWKSGVVEMLVRLFGVDELLFVDDEPAIYESVAALDLPCTCKVNASLQAALAML